MVHRNFELLRCGFVDLLGEVFDLEKKEVEERQLGRRRDLATSISRRRHPKKKTFNLPSSPFSVRFLQRSKRRRRPTENENYELSQEGEVLDLRRFASRLLKSYNSSGGGEEKGGIAFHAHDRPSVPRRRVIQNSTRSATDSHLRRS